MSKRGHIGGDEGQRVRVQRLHREQASRPVPCPHPMGRVAHGQPDRVGAGEGQWVPHDDRLLPGPPAARVRMSRQGCQCAPGLGLLEGKGGR